MDNLTTLAFENFTSSVKDDLNLTLAVTPAQPKPRPRGTPFPPGYYAETRETMWMVIPPIIMVWGITGNILTVLVLVRQMRKIVSSTSLYLMALAFSDTLILLCGSLRNFIHFTWDKDVREYSDAGCRMQYYFTYASLHLSSWLLVAVTMERVLSVVRPHKVRLGCTPRNAGLVILLIFLCVFALNVCVPVINGRDAYNKGLKCGPTSKEYLDFRDDVWHWIDFCVAFAVPFLILLVGNIVIIAHLHKSRQQQKRMTTSRSASSKMTSVSVLLVLLCFVFFATMTPVSVFQVYYPYRYKEITNMKVYKDAWYAYQYLLFEHAVVNIVSYTNASFNFIMYVLSGSKFRKELKALLCCLCPKQLKEKGSTVKTQTTSNAKTPVSSQKASAGGQAKESKDNSVSRIPLSPIGNNNERLEQESQNQNGGTKESEIELDQNVEPGEEQNGEIVQSSTNETEKDSPTVNGKGVNGSPTGDFTDISQESINRENTSIAESE